MIRLVELRFERFS